MISIFVAAFAFLILVFSSWGIARPRQLIDWIQRMTGKPFMFIAVGARVVLAIILWLAAPEARHPLVFQVMAVIAALAALGMLIVGKDRLLGIINWFTERAASVQRGWLLLGIGFGAYLLWAIWPALPF